jgi:RING finger/CHY zinc finger protein 1
MIMNTHDSPNPMDVTEATTAGDNSDNPSPFNESNTATLTIEEVMGGSNLVPEQDTTIQKRKAIRALMQDKTLSENTRRLKIQQLMDGSNPTTILHQLHHEQQSEHPLHAGRSEEMTLPTHAQTSQVTVVPGGCFPCVHYERKCNVVAPCCHKIYGCRVCHDEFTNCEHGPMDRFHVQEIVCKVCNTRQNAKTNVCSNPDCRTQFAEYHCDRCNLWMELSKQPFHCDECGFCRVGGVEKYRHCNLCSMCINAETYNDHHCLKDKFKNNCPVCHDDMFTSRHAAQDLPCGHAIHTHCFRKLAGFDYRCPICKKTVVSQSSMSRTWAERAQDIQRQPMPADLNRVVNIMCYDCEAKSSNLQWHFLGVQCPSCNSFNTVVENVL